MNRLRAVLISLIVLVLAGFAGYELFLDPGYGTQFGDHEGYTLWRPQLSTEVYLMDAQGRIVNQWTVSDHGRDAVLRENGNLVVSVTPQNLPEDNFAADVGFTEIDGRFEEYTWDGELVWAYEPTNPNWRVHHGVEVLPNGNIMFIVWEYITNEEAIANGRDPEKLGDGLWPDVFVEYDPNAEEIVWEWRVWDHLIQDFDPDKANYGSVEDNPQLVDINFYEPIERIEDWMHSNSIDYNAELDQVVFSVREFHEAWVIDHDTTTEEARGEAGDILYRWGNPRAYDRGDESDKYLWYQHDVQWIPSDYPGGGNFLSFSNRNPVSDDEDGQFSQVVEFAPPLLADGTYELNNGEAYAPAEPTWVYPEEPITQFFSPFISGTQRLPNGNTLITQGQAGRIFEVTPDGDIAWEYLAPVNDGEIVADDEERSIRIFRARRYQPDYPAFEGRDLTPQLTLQEAAQG